MTRGPVWGGPWTGLGLWGGCQVSKPQGRCASFRDRASWDREGNAGTGNKTRFLPNPPKAVTVGSKSFECLRIPVTFVQYALKGTLKIILITTEPARMACVQKAALIVDQHHTLVRYALLSLCVHTCVCTCVYLSVGAVAGTPYRSSS